MSKLGQAKTIPGHIGQEKKWLLLLNGASYELGTSANVLRATKYSHIDPKQLQNNPF